MKNETRVGRTNVGAVYLKDGELTLTVDPGMHVGQVCTAMAEWSSLNQLSLTTEFNGIQIKSTPDSKASDLLSYWENECAHRQAEYEATPEYADQKRKDAEDVSRRQTEVDRIVSEIPSVIKKPFELMSLLSRLSVAADRIGVMFDTRALADVLQTAWRRGDCVGMRGDTIRSSQSLMERYIIGQAIECMCRHMPPHPIIETWFNDYKDFYSVPAPETIANP